MRKCSANVASATGFYLRESVAAAADVFCAKAQCQRSGSNNNNNNMMLVTQAFSQDVKLLA
ncbi:hypothetical protein [Lysinibacillus xylanilyticus]|uniref:hypothetical protein n=1 Tax=Lysinibacillus xylanilyticus TaxID=582475 RepID=UPI003D0209F8